jgi:hypothetical protein
MEYLIYYTKQVRWVVLQLQKPYVYQNNGGTSTSELGVIVLNLFSSADQEFWATQPCDFEQDEFGRRYCCHFQGGRSLLYPEDGGETWIRIYRTTMRHIPGDNHL